MAQVRFRQVRKAFGPHEVIHGVDLNIADGEFIVFVGPSGCGKTTLLRLLAGLETLSSGQIFIGEADVSDVPARARNIAMVFQNYALYPHMTVAQNMAFGLKLRGMPKPERGERVRDAARLLNLEDLLDRKPRQLSGGQRQRVAMGRAIVREPDVFLMDEPLSNLDAQLRAQMRKEIKDLQHRLTTTMIYVTHDQVEAMTMADRIVVIKDGEIQQFGSPAELFERPANQFVASFIGSPAMNFLDFNRNGARMFATRAGHQLPLSRKLDSALGAAEHVTLGVRPKDLILAGRSKPKVSWPGKVETVEPLGGETLVHADLSGEALTVQLDGTVSLQPGEEIELGFDPAKSPIHLFERGTGRRLM